MYNKDWKGFIDFCVEWGLSGDICGDQCSVRLWNSRVEFNIQNHDAGSAQIWVSKWIQEATYPDGWD